MRILFSFYTFGDFQMIANMVIMIGNFQMSAIMFFIIFCDCKDGVMSWNTLEPKNFSILPECINMAVGVVLLTTMKYDHYD